MKQSTALEQENNLSQALILVVISIHPLNLGQWDSASDVTLHTCSCVLAASLTSFLVWNCCLISFGNVVDIELDIISVSFCVHFLTFFMCDNTV